MQAESKSGPATRDVLEKSDWSRSVAVGHEEQVTQCSRCCRSKGFNAPGDLAVATAANEARPGFFERHRPARPRLQVEAGRLQRVQTCSHSRLHATFSRVVRINLAHEKQLDRASARRALRRAAFGCAAPIHRGGIDEAQPSSIARAQTPRFPLRAAARCSTIYQRTRPSSELRSPRSGQRDARPGSVVSCRLG